jgi:hypothetical protein
MLKSQLNWKGTLMRFATGLDSFLASSAASSSAEAENAPVSSARESPTLIVFILRNLEVVFGDQCLVLELETSDILAVM